ncbi:MAG: hypothetical protein AMS22_16110 [Thiotrichales bacterium SG8_50]|nr:MAG: hypothetical protein AMS22_16110 [Thiotrichales bacterium SG8_50]
MANAFVEHSLKARFVREIDCQKESDKCVRLYRLPDDTFVTLFPDGNIEYLSTDEGWEEDIRWRYNQAA